MLLNSYKTNPAVLVANRKTCQKDNCCRDEMFKCISGKTRKDRIRNDNNRDNLGVGPIEDKIRETNKVG